MHHHFNNPNVCLVLNFIWLFQTEGNNARWNHYYQTNLVHKLVPGFYLSEVVFLLSQVNLVIQQHGKSAEEGLKENCKSKVFQLKEGKPIIIFYLYSSEKFLKICKQFHIKINQSVKSWKDVSVVFELTFLIV